MGVTAKALKKPLHLLVHHRVFGHGIHELIARSTGRKFAMEQQVAGFKVVALNRELFDGVPGKAIRRDRHR